MVSAQFNEDVKIQNEYVNIKEEIYVIENPLKGRDDENDENPLQMEDIEIKVKVEIELYASENSQWV